MRFWLVLQQNESSMSGMSVCNMGCGLCKKKETKKKCFVVCPYFHRQNWIGLQASDITIISRKKKVNRLNLMLYSQSIGIVVVHYQIGTNSFYCFDKMVNGGSENILLTWIRKDKKKETEKHFLRLFWLHWICFWRDCWMLNDCKL